MTTMADGSAVAGLVVNVFIALGTVGAAGVALWLGLQARKASTVQEREYRQNLNRQVLCIYSPARRHIDSWVEVVNASPEPITSVQVQVRGNVRAADGSPQVAWAWSDESLIDAFPMINYLLSGASVQLLGAFWPTESAPPSPQGRPRASVPLKDFEVTVELMWQDAHGQVWNKRGQDEAFPTSWAAPWRDLRGAVPRYAWPSYWPPLEPDRAREPMRERARRTRQRLRRRVRHPRD